MDSMYERRAKLRLTQVQLAQISGVNNNIIDGLERGLRTPTPGQRMRLAAALGGEFYFLSEEEEAKMLTNVPVMPEMQWKDGRPDFSQLDGEKAAVRDQLQTLIADQHGVRAVLREMGLERCFYEVMDEDGSTIYAQPYIVTNGKASLDGHGEVVPAAEFSVLSRRRIRRGGVPNPANPDQEQQ